MLESGERAGAVAIHLAMRAVVQTKDIARSCCGRLRGASQVSLGASGDGLQARNQPLQRPFLPITGKQSPHDGTVAKFTGTGNHPRIAKAKGRPKPLWRRAQSIGNRVVAEAQLNPDFQCFRSEEHTSELQSLTNLVCRLLLEKKKKKKKKIYQI